MNLFKMAHENHFVVNFLLVECGWYKLLLCVQVLLLEAGGDPPLESEVPVFSLSFYGGKTPHNWDYEAERQSEACLGLKSERCPWKNGKMIGGSGAHNAMTFLRGTRRVSSERPYFT